MSTNSEGRMANDKALSEEILIEDPAPRADDAELVDDDGIHEFLAELRQVRKQIDHVNGRVDDYLMRMCCRRSLAEVSPVDDGFMAAVFERFDNISAGLKGIEQPLELLLKTQSTGGDSHSSIAEVNEQQRATHEQLSRMVVEQLESHRHRIEHLQAEMTDGFERLTKWLRPSESALTGNLQSHGQWRETIFGRRLVENPNISEELDDLEVDILKGNSAAISLAGQLLSFRSATSDRMPQLLKDLGEAFYRCRPKTSDVDSPLETALRDSLQLNCESAGVPNRIELVHTGERFDSTRHTATGRGGMINEVHGWVVLRDSGRVYTKATVSVT